MWTLSPEHPSLVFDEPIFWRVEIESLGVPKDAHICTQLEFYIYESGEFWQIRKRDNDA